VDGRDGDGKGVTILATDEEVNAWKRQTGWNPQQPNPSLVFQEAILGPTQISVGLVCCKGKIAAMAFVYRLTVASPGQSNASSLFVYGRLGAAKASVDFPSALPAKVVDTVARVVQRSRLDGFVNFDIKIRLDGRPAFMEANMRIDGTWLKAGTLGKSIEAYFRCLVPRRASR